MKNYDVLRSKTNLKMSLLNLLMNLRLVANHPILFEFKNNYELPDREHFREEFIEKSNKLKILEKIIKKLLAQKHKILIFSQFTMMLNVIEDFCDFFGW